jgi:hypothetical protein
MKKKFKTKGENLNVFLRSFGFSHYDPEQRNLEFWVRFLRGEKEVVTSDIDMIEFIRTAIPEENLIEKNVERNWDEEWDFRQECLKWYASLTEQQKEYAEFLQYALPAKAPCGTTNPENEE